MKHIITTINVPTETFIRLKLMGKVDEKSASRFLSELIEKEWERRIADSSLGNQLNERVREIVASTLKKIVKQKKVTQSNE